MVLEIRKSRDEVRVANNQADLDLVIRIKAHAK